MSAVDLIERLREYAKDWRERAADKAIVDEAADALAAKDAALSEMRAELAEAKRLYDVQIAGHRLSAKDATTNLIRATKAEAQLERARKALSATLTWAEQRCPCHHEEPNPCPLCGASVENLEACKSAENTLPRHILEMLRSARPSALASQDEGEER